MRRAKDPLSKTGKRGAANQEALHQVPPYLRYQYALEVLFTFNMNLQDDYLHDFIVAYRRIDVGKDGVLTHSELHELVNKFGSLETIRDGSSAYALLQEAKASTLTHIGHTRRLTFSETVELFSDLLSARWSVTGKKGKRYQVHDKLKQELARE